MLLTVINKELKRVFTDRRLVISTFIIPALSIYIIYTLMGSMITNMVGDIKEHESIIYINNAPSSFIDYYEEIKDNYNTNITFGNYNISDYTEDIRNGEIDLFITFEDEFDIKTKNYTENDIAPEIKTYFNPAEEYSSEARNVFVYDILENYEINILTDRFGNIGYINAFEIDIDNQDSIIVNEKKASSLGLGMMVPMLLAIILFAGAMGIGMDTIAGEKERGTMATLLLTPVPRETIALGKVIGLGIVAIISATTSFTAIIASLPNMMGSLEEEANMGMGLSFEIHHYIQLLIIMITLVGIYVGLICLISVRARSVKEAGTYIAPIYMVIMIAALSTTFAKSSDAALYKFAIPVYGSVLAIKDMFAFELSIQEFAVTTLFSFVTAVILVKLITITFNDEKVMFNA